MVFNYTIFNCSILDEAIDETDRFGALIHAFFLWCQFFPTFVLPSLLPLQQSLNNFQPPILNTTSNHEWDICRPDSLEFVHSICNCKSMNDLMKNAPVSLLFTRFVSTFKQQLIYLSESEVDYLKKYGLFWYSACFFYFFVVG